jgi:hypothetical protein
MADVTNLMNGEVLKTDPALGGSLFNLMQCIGALRIEVNTGMRHSKGSVLAHSPRTFGVTARTKKGALEELEELYLHTTGRNYGTP